MHFYQNYTMAYESDSEKKYEKNSDEKYYMKIENMLEHSEDKELPSFNQIFNDVPKGSGIFAFCDYYKGTIYFTAVDGHLYAIDEMTGIIKWKFRMGGPSISSPLVHNERIYFGSNDSYFYCVDMNGELVWKINTGDIMVCSAVAAGGRIFIGNGSGYLFCFSTEGKELWRFKTGDGI